jgi:carbamoyltransferase
MESQLMKIVQLLPEGGYRLNVDYFRHHREAISDRFEGGIPAFRPLYSATLERLLGPSRAPGEELTQRHRNIAASVQKVYQNALFHLLNRLHASDPVNRLALAGGCAMNSVANGHIRKETPFCNVYVQPAAGDAGGALGSALVVSRRLGVVDPDPMPDAYLGPEFTDLQVSRSLTERDTCLREAGCQVQRMEETALLDRVVQGLKDGGVVGWFQGRMEWGARALGNRSILADPRREDIQSLLNRKIKRRESFRPFAPSILREYVADWFEDDDDEPYMQKVCRIHPNRRGEIPAVTHVDGSGRLQTVDRDRNPLYYRLIEHFYRQTGVPMLLNTSFNENEPIVCRPEEALDCFLRTRMDLLVMGCHAVWRPME